MKSPKIRREWVRHPATKIKESKKNKDECEECGAYKIEPMMCANCEVGNDEDRQT